MRGCNSLSWAGAYVPAFELIPCIRFISLLGTSADAGVAHLRLRVGAGGSTFSYQVPHHFPQIYVFILGLAVSKIDCHPPGLY